MTALQISIMSWALVVALVSTVGLMALMIAALIVSGVMDAIRAMRE